MSNYKVGQKAEIRRKITRSEVLSFAKLSGDRNPLHCDETYPKKCGYHGAIVHGAFLNALISSVISGKLPGKGTVYISQNIRYIRPLYVGEEVTVSVKITELLPDGKICLRTDCKNAKGERIAIGKALTAPPSDKDLDESDRK